MRLIASEFRRKGLTCVGMVCERRWSRSNGVDSSKSPICQAFTCSSTFGQTAVTRHRAGNLTSLAHFLQAITNEVNPITQHTLPGKSDGLSQATHGLYGLTVYLCDPLSPWQHRSEKNLNGSVRQDLPKVIALPRGYHNCTVQLLMGLSGRLRATPGLPCLFGV